MGGLYTHYSHFQGEWPWRNFTPAEVACKHCGEFFYDFKAMTALQLLRDGWGKPIIINSGHRCTVHNASPEVGGKPASLHLKIAFDCRCQRTDQPEFAKLAKRVGFTGILQYRSRGFVHLDLRAVPYEMIYP